jgi:hypothetical protein
MSLLACSVRPHSNVFGEKDFRMALALGSIWHSKRKSRVAVLLIDVHKHARGIPNGQSLLPAKRRGRGERAQEECESEPLRVQEASVAFSVGGVRVHIPYRAFHPSIT